MVYAKPVVFAMGGNAMAASWLALSFGAILDSMGYPVIYAPPLKGKPGKRTTSKQFIAETGWTTPTSEHARDAFYIIDSTWHGKAKLQGKL